MLSATGGRTALRCRIGAQLRALRTRCGVTRDEAAAVVHASVQTIGHIETGRSLPNGLQLERLLTRYGAADLLPAYLELRRRAKAGGDWWAGLAAAVPRSRALLYGGEATAERIEVWDPLQVPELARTPDSARALAAAGTPAADVEARVELLLARQRAVLDRPAGAGPAVSLLVGEAALRRSAATGTATATAQVEHLVALAGHPGVELRVVPLAATTPDAATGPFTVLTFPGPGTERAVAPAAAYAETLVEGHYYDHAEAPERVARYRAALTALRAAALPAADTPAFLRALVR